jgi:lipopolysaccharide transport system ATP-binding protein
MTFIKADSISIDFPVYGIGNRSLKKSILNLATGGRLASDSSNHIVIRALDQVSFDFVAGDRIGLVGHNGSGKSTLLRVLAGVYEPTKGSLVVEGKISSMISISMGMDSEATGIENIFIRGNLMGIRPKHMKNYLDEIVDFSGLGNYINLPIRTLSSGMVMRLAFSIATSIKADIILMDEWLSVGDTEFLEKAQMRLENFLGAANIVVLASHNYGLIQKQCNKIYKLDHGVLNFISPI